MYRDWVLFVLTLVNFQAQFQKFLLTYTQGDTPRQDIKKALHLSETQYAILVGPAFSLLFVISGLFMGLLSDRANRRCLLLISALLFSLTTFATSYVTSFWQILLLRIALGICESTVDPASFSLISDYFVPERRNMASSVYNLAAYIGSALSNVSLALVTYVGWRQSYFYLGIVGIVNSFLLLLIKEPKRGTFDYTPARPHNQSLFLFLKETLVYCCKHSVLRWIFIACAVRLSASYLIAFFFVNFATGVFPAYNYLFSYIQAAIILVSGTLSSFLGSYISDQAEKKGISGAKGYVPAIGLMVAIPLEIIAWIVLDNFAAVISVNGTAYLFSECWNGPIFSLALNSLPQNMRGTGMALNLFFFTITSDIFVIIFGNVLDAVNSQQFPQKVGLYLAVFVAALYCLASGLFLKVGINKARLMSNSSASYMNLEEDSQAWKT